MFHIFHSKNTTTLEMERKEVTDCTKSYRLMLSDGGEAAKVLVPFEDIALGMPGLEWCWKLSDFVFLFHLQKLSRPKGLYSEHSDTV